VNKTKVWKTTPLVRQDFPNILAIEKLSSLTPWYPATYETLMCNAGGMETTGIVVRDRSVTTLHNRGQCVGVCLTRRIDSELHILRLCVDPDWRGKGVGSALFCAVRERIEANPGRYRNIRVSVPERHYDSIVPFFAKMGCRVWCCQNLGTMIREGMISYKPEENDAD